MVSKRFNNVKSAMLKYFLKSCVIFLLLLVKVIGFVSDRTEVKLQNNRAFYKFLYCNNKSIVRFQSIT